MFDCRLQFQALGLLVDLGANPCRTAQRLQHITLRSRQANRNYHRRAVGIERFPAGAFPLAAALDVNGRAFPAVAGLCFADGLLHLSDAWVNDGVQPFLFRAPAKAQQHVVGRAVLARVRVAEAAVVIDGSNPVGVLFSPCLEGRRHAGRLVFDREGCVHA